MCVKKNPRLNLRGFLFSIFKFFFSDFISSLPSLHLSFRLFLPLPLFLFSLLS